MNLKNRLEKIEGKVNRNGRNCTCQRIKTKIYQADLTKNAVSQEPRLRGNGVPDICEQCRRPIGKTKIILQFVDREALENKKEVTGQI